MKSAGLLDDFLNVLLFVPFGFGLAGELSARGTRRVASLLSCLVAGALVSYGVEFLQNFIPSRDAGWHDVMTNSTGSVVGFVFFAFTGERVLRYLHGMEAAISDFVTFRRAVWIGSLYFGAWLLFSVPLQQHARIANWDPNALLTVGNFAAGKQDTAWKGQVSRLELWDRSTPNDLAEEITSGKLANQPLANLIGSYDFSAALPLKDGTGHLPDLTWNIAAIAAKTAPGTFDGQAWLISAAPAPLLAKRFAETNQFSLHLVCTPDSINEPSGRILTISRGPASVNLDVKQEGRDLVFWFRNRLAIRRSTLAWNVSDVFEPRLARNILISFDGDRLSLFVDGRRESNAYLIGPAAVLAHFFRSIKTSELEAYNYVYYALIFFLGGIIVGIAVRNPGPGRYWNILSLGVAFLIPSGLLEAVLMHAADRPLSYASIALGVCLTAGGALWINADV